MKILHINTAESGGGAAIAARRHCQAMRRAGYDARLLIAGPLVSGASWISNLGKKGRILALINSKFDSLRQRRSSPYGTWSSAYSGLNVASHPWVKEADVIILHWVNGGMLSIKGVEKILRSGKPVYWYLHDMWPMTGGCHYSLDCDRFIARCGGCPLLNNHAGSGKNNDRSSHIHQRKFSAWSKYSNLHILAPSQWLADCARRSSLFANCSVKVLVNPIDTELFKPLDKAEARRAYNLPADKKLILFGAANPKDPYKGWSLLKDAISSLQGHKDIELIVFGNAESQTFETGSITCHKIGRLTDPIALTMLYSAADLFVIPSIAENYPNVVAEAMSCGLPCVGFRTGGVPDLIHNYQTGLIAPETTGQSLADTITKALSKDFNPRPQIIETNSFAAIADAYNQIFNLQYVNETN